MKGNRADLHRCAARKLPGLAALTSAAKPPPALYSHTACQTAQRQTVPPVGRS